MSIVGWYVANETSTDRSLNEHTIKTIEKISRQNENAVVFLVGVGFLRRGLQVGQYELTSAFNRLTMTISICTTAKTAPFW